MRRQDKQVSTTIAMFQIPQLFSTIAWNLSGAENVAFTMAEILLSLTIIGVVAAITLPSLTGNINERTWNTQRKALYARFSQAISLMPSLNGYGTLVEGTDSTSAQDTAAETFITAGLSKVLKINNICDSEHLSDCGIASKITPLSGSILNPIPATLRDLNSTMAGSIVGNYGGNAYIINTKAAAFETQNGESILVYYNPNCNGSLGEKPFGETTNSGGYKIQSKICANFIYDLNGSKGPNTVGKDIGFMTALYPTDAQLYAPNPSNSPQSTERLPRSEMLKACTQYDTNYRLPNLGEVASMFINSKLIGLPNSTSFHVGASDLFIPSQQTPTWNTLVIYMTSGLVEDVPGGGVWCVKR